MMLRLLEESEQGLRYHNGIMTQGTFGVGVQFCDRCSQLCGNGLNIPECHNRNHQLCTPPPSSFSTPVLNTDTDTLSSSQKPNSSKVVSVGAIISALTNAMSIDEVAEIIERIRLRVKLS